MDRPDTTIKHFPIEGTKDLKEVKYVPTDVGKLKAIDGNQKPDTVFLYFTIITGCLSVVSGTANYAWPSPVLPKLLSNDTQINPLDKPITTMEISMIIGLPALTGTIGSLLGPLSDKIGRKKCLQIIALGMILCNVVTAFSSKVIYLIISRCIFFMFFATVLTIMPVFVTEMTEDHNRTKYGSLMQFFGPLGILYCYLLGPYLNIKMLTLCVIFPCLLSFVLLFFVPETPFFLMSLGRAAECREVLKKLRSNKHDKELEIDLNTLYETLKLTNNAKKIKITSIFKIKEAKIGFMLAFIINLLNYGSGGPLLAPFIGPIFTHSETGISGDTVGIIMATLKCALFFITSLVVQKFGKKPLLFVSSVGCGLFMLVLTWYFYLERLHSPLVNHLSWLPVVTIALYFVSYSIGVGSIPSSIIGEMFVIELRSAASSLISFILSIFIFLMSSVIPILYEKVGIYVCFGLFGFNCLLGAVFIYSMLPETRGKSLIEIQEILRNYEFGLRWKS